MNDYRFLIFLIISDHALQWMSKVLQMAIWYPYQSTEALKTYTTQRRLTMIAASNESSMNGSVDSNNYKIVYGAELSKDGYMKMVDVSKPGSNCKDKSPYDYATNN